MRTRALSIVLLALIALVSNLPTGSGVVGASATIDPSSFNFGERNVGSSPINQVFVVTSTGPVDFEFSGAKLTGTDALQFQLDRPPVTGCEASEKLAEDLLSSKPPRSRRRPPRSLHLATTSVSSW
jgi:hypothetical protein